MALLVEVIGLFKNPTSYWNVALKDPIEAAERIVIASIYDESLTAVPQNANSRPFGRNFGLQQAC